jgi:hypothetical protein
MSDTRRLDEVSIFNDKLTFLIPHEWIEAESGEDGTYLYQLADARSGWLRVSLITQNDVVDPAARLREVFSQHANVAVSKTTGNLIRRSEKETIQDGERLHIYYWFVGGCVPPTKVCEAVFSYTVLADLINNDETESEVTLLGQLVGEARFNPPAFTNA